MNIKLPQFIFFAKVLSIRLSSLIHQGRGRGGTWLKLIWHRRGLRQESNFLNKQKIFTQILDALIKKNCRKAPASSSKRRRGANIKGSSKYKGILWRVRDIKKRISVWTESGVFHLRKLKPNCSFTPSALPLGASLSAVTTRKNTSPYFFTGEI